MYKDRDWTYDLRLGYVVDLVPVGCHPGIEIAGTRWGTIDGLVAAVPDQALGHSDFFRPLPPGVVVANTNYDGMVVLR